MVREKHKTKCSKCGKMVETTVGLSAPGVGPTKEVCLSCFGEQCKAVGRMIRDKDYHALRLSDWLAMLLGPLAYYFYLIARNSPSIP